MYKTYTERCPTSVKSRFAVLLKVHLWHPINNAEKWRENTQWVFYFTECLYSRKVTEGLLQKDGFRSSKTRLE